MSNEIMGETKNTTYKCQICSKETKNTVDAMAHYLDHGSTALEAVTAMIKEQRTGGVTNEDRARITEENRVTSQKAKTMTATQGA